MSPPRQLRIRTTSGTADLPLPETGDGTLADWLAENGHPLNTRCGGRGICRGCRVEIDGQSQRACQLPVAELSDRTSELFIPDSSLHDEKLDGVSAFEIGLGGLNFRRRPGIGLALDIGTTTVAAAIWDLSDGRCLAEGTAANAQRRHGDNVLARIESARATGSSRTLQKTLLERSVHPLVAKLLEESGLEPGSITEAIASGNTVMLHTLVAAPLDGFAAYPFRPVFLDGRICRAEELGFASDFPLRLVPGLGAFVGGDITAGALASGMFESDRPSLLIDFGTNGEILLKTPEGSLAAATAAGPAFEGGRLNCGRPAAPGVIGALRFEDGRWRGIRIGGEKARPVPGLAGSAYVDFMAEARGNGLLSRMGRFERGHPLLRTRDIDGEATPAVEVGPDVFITEADIAELMQAKAAILGGTHALMEEAGVGPAELESVYVAGGFGYHLHPGHALAVGLLPDVPRERIHVIGNSSLAGASLLLQTEIEADLERLRRQCRALELNQIDSFEDHFIDAMPLETCRPE
ncbi:MAG: ASKHA domain-containing protein [Opitutales bacterium]